MSDAGYFVNEGSCINDNVTIGTGAVVTSNVPAHTLMFRVLEKRMGWVRECSEALKDGFVCSKCGRKYKESKNDYLEAEDLGMAVVKFKNGAVATIEGTTNVYPKNLEETLYLFGEKGTVKLGGKSTNAIDVWDFSDEHDADDKNKGLCEETSNVYGNGHTSLYADVMDAIRTDRRPYVDAVAGRNALELVLAIYKSQKEGKPVKLPLVNFASLDMVGEF